MTDDNHEFTTESELDEQTFESKTNDVAAFIAGVCSDDEYEPVFIDPKDGRDESSAHRCITGQIGSGRTSTKSRKFFKRLLTESNDETGAVWFDPKEEESENDG